MRDVSDHTSERELAVVAALRDAGEAASPRPDETERMRERVLAEAARSGWHDSAVDDSAVDDSAADDSVTPIPSQRGPRHARRPSIAARARGRLLVAAAAVCLLMSLSGTSLLLSRDALPGETLYAFKRSAESAELSMTFGAESKAAKHLEFATTRLTEIGRMAARADAPGTGNPSTQQYIAALDDFDSGTRAATRLLTGMAADGKPGVLSMLRGWAAQQEQRLDSLAAAMPDEADSRVAGSSALLDEVLQRATALQNRADCRHLTSGVSDELGPLPAEDSCISQPGAASAESLSEPTQSTTPRPGPGDAEVPVPDRQSVPDAPRPPDLNDVLPGDKEWEDLRERGPLPPNENTPPSDPPPPRLPPLPLLSDISTPSPHGPESQPR